MKKSSRMLSLLLSACMLLAFAGCGSTPAASTPDAPPAASSPASSAPALSESIPEPLDYPTQAIECIVPFAPGGGNDSLTRILMKYIDLPHPMVAVNVEGAGGLVGAQETYRADNDGYTILCHNPMNLISQSLGGSTDIPLWQELEPICFIADDQDVIVTLPGGKFETAEELFAYAKANPGTLTWSVTGAQSIAMADAIRCNEAIGAEATMVPYDSGSTNRTALLGGHVDLALSTVSDMRALVESGEVIALFVVAEERSPFLPDVPTLKELGYDVTTGTPRGFYAPPGTSQEIIDYLALKMEEVSENPEFIQEMNDMGLEVKYVSPAEVKELSAEWVENLTPVYEGFGG